MNAHQTLLNYTHEQFHDYLKRFDEIMGRELGFKILDEFATAPDMYSKNRELFKYKIAKMIHEYIATHFTPDEVQSAFCIHRAEVMITALGEAARAKKQKN